MATLNLSTNGPSIAKSYNAVVNAPNPSGGSAGSPTYGQWALFSVSAPLINAFQKDSMGKESVLKVQSSGEGELADLIEEFSDGRIQFAFVKVRDPNSSLPKNVLIGWCGEGVPERTKGYFTSHLAAVGKVLHGYHVQITARSESDLSPDLIIRKVSEASGSNYSGASAPATSGRTAPPPPPASKPAFTPTRIGGGGSGGYNPLAARSSPGPVQNRDDDKDGWGQDAPPVVRSDLERVQSAYKPTKVNMEELKRTQEPSRFSVKQENSGIERSDVIKGGYQPVGKVDIAALRRQAEETGSAGTDRPAPVQGAYEPVGKVDIAAIRARAQPPSSDSGNAPKPFTQPGQDARSGAGPLADRAGSSAQSERLTSLPKPKVSNKFGSGASNFTGTKAPTPGGFGLETKPASPATPVGAAGRTFADEGGKTPAQIWAEKKARERGLSGASDTTSPAAGSRPAPTVSGQKSGGEWKSSYAGKSWAPVQTTTTGRSAGSSNDQQNMARGDEYPEEASRSPGGIESIRNRFNAEEPAASPGISKSTAFERPGVSSPDDDRSGGAAPFPGLPARPGRPREEEDEEEQPVRMPTPPAVPRSPTPPTPPAMGSSSPIRVAMPVSRGKEVEVVPPEERFSAPPIPVESISSARPREEDLTDEPAGHDPARAAGEAAAAVTFGEDLAHSANPGARAAGKRALVQFDYEKAEGNEIDLIEGEYVTNIEMVDEDWWMGQNSKGESGLFPSNYVELVDDDHEEDTPAARVSEEQAEAGDTGPSAAEPVHGQESDDHAAAATAASGGHTAIAVYDYEAAEANELSFAEGERITDIEFPDEDWWFGHAGNKEGLFPANYVQLEE